MEINVLTFIEVQNVSGIWAVKLSECKTEMQPVVPAFISVNNDISNEDVIYIDNTLLDTKPEKIIEGVNGGKADGFIEVGFWRIKHKTQINNDYALSA